MNANAAGKQKHQIHISGSNFRGEWIKVALNPSQNIGLKASQTGSGPVVAADTVKPGGDGGESQGSSGTTGKVSTGSIGVDNSEDPGNPVLPGSNANESKGSSGGESSVNSGAGKASTGPFGIDNSEDPGNPVLPGSSASKSKGSGKYGGPGSRREEHEQVLWI
jgi:hypothetical protein